MKEYLKKHLDRYPLMQIEDVLKLYLQGILGPAHLVDEEKTLNQIEQEYLSIKDLSYNYEIEEEISDSYLRIYLKPYYDKYLSFEKLAKVFYLSSLEENDVELFKKQVEELKDVYDANYIENYLKSDNFLISHSQIYKNNYHPHYLVIHKKYRADIR